MQGSVAPFPRRPGYQVIHLPRAEWKRLPLREREILCAFSVRQKTTRRGWWGPVEFWFEMRAPLAAMVLERLEPVPAWSVGWVAEAEDGPAGEPEETC